MSPSDFVHEMEPHYAGLVQRLTLVLHDAEEARDVAQESYLRAWRAWDRFDGTDARAWLHTIGLRLAFNRQRGLRRFSNAVARAGANARDPLWVPPDRLDLWWALGNLKPEVRAALLLNVLDGYTQAEIASILDVPPGTVASWVATGKSRVREELTGPAEVAR